LACYIQHGFYCGILFRDFGLSASEYKHILRIAGKDIEGGKKLIVALSEIKGVGYNFAQVLIQSLNINPNMRVGFLTESDIHEIEQAISNPARAGIPQWYLNRRKNMDDGSNNHMITSDLDFAASNDIEREKLVMSWRGYRHMFGLRVRGQCTRTTGSSSCSCCSCCRSCGGRWYNQSSPTIKGASQEIDRGAKWEILVRQRKPFIGPE
jgi:small subunit ribosomal protein S13